MVQEFTMEDGVHLTWEYCHSTRTAHDELPIPFSALAELLRPVDGMHVLPYPPSFCAQCKSALNCYCEVDFGQSVWRCPLCATQQALPSHYRGITEEHLPAELFPGASVVEHELPPSSQRIQAPLVLFLLDMCVSEDDLGAMKQSLQQVLSTMPESTRIGIITFGSMVYLHDLMAANIATSVVFRGSQEATKADVSGLIRRGGSLDSPFIAPFSSCSFAVDGVLDGLMPEASAPGCRHQRATGAALSVAAAVLEACAHGNGGHVLLLAGGPCTLGPGQIVSLDYAEPLRTHKDLAKGAAKFFATSAAFYDRMAHRLIENGQAMDVFASCLDQTGLAEMEHLAVCTGGLLVTAEHFAHEAFRTSFARLLSPEALPPAANGAAADADDALPWCLNASLEVSPGRGLAVAGAIGPLASLEQRGGSTSEPAIGLGDTTAWKLNALGPETAAALFFRPTAKGKDKAPAGGSPLVFQTRLAYQHPSGARRLRVVTKATYWVDPTTAAGSLGYSATTGAIMLARWVAYEASRGADSRTLSSWLDRQLVALSQRSAKFTPGEAGSVALPAEFAAMPELVFHLRRSAFLNVFGNAPDETVFYRSLLFREGKDACALMLRPRLLSFTFDGAEPVELPLDIAAVPVDAVVVFDSWFNVIVHTGSHVAAWVKQGLLEDPSYAHVRDTIAAAHGYAESLIEARQPRPRRVVCDQGTSQARFLLARLNPSQTQMNTDGQAVGAVIFTDDVPFDVFMEQLRGLIVA
eukprot:jgi/Ulvmu1/10657/UM066_0038.1